MRITLIADSFAPLRNSAAIQLHDLAVEMLRQGHLPMVLVPSADISLPWLHEVSGGIEILRLRAPRTKDVSYIRRTLAEFFMPFAMLWSLRKSPYSDLIWDGVVWYSPSIFLGPLSHRLKRASACRSYLILRDIFPEWAVDMGLLRRGIAYRCFKTIERYQYSVADVIGVQTHANLSYFDSWPIKSLQRVEVLQNWLADAPNVGCSISVADSPLAKRKIFVYAGNMGIAQGMGLLLDLAERLLYRKDVGFLFVGRGSGFNKMQCKAKTRLLDNVVFFDEIDPSEIPGLYAQCHIGLVSLDQRHKTHNIPGKFLSYMQSGLPVLAAINPGNDLEVLINTERVGRVCAGASGDVLLRLAEELLEDMILDTEIGNRCRNLAHKLFSPEQAVKQIVAALCD